MTRLRPVRPALVAALATLAAAPGLAAQTAHWYIGTYSNDVLVWDEASEAVIDRITMRHRIPMDLYVSEGQDRLYVRDASGENIEVVDLATREVVDELTLSEDSVTVRINSFAPDPTNRTALMHIMRYVRHVDRYTVEGPFVVSYDLEAKRVTDTIPHPDGETPDNPGYRLSFRYAPDGRTVYFFAQDVIVVDAETFREVDRWALSEPLEPGLGRGSFATASTTYDEEGIATSLFRVTDPVNNRRMLGIARVRLSEQEVDFFTLGTAEPVNRFTLAPGGEKAYALYDEIGRYEFWEFDLVAQRVSRRQPFAGRPRMGLQVSADGEKLFVHVAGNTIDVYDSGTFELLRTVELDDDMTGVAIIPVR